MCWVVACGAAGRRGRRATRLYVQAMSCGASRADVVARVSRLYAFFSVTKVLPGHVTRLAMAPRETSSTERQTSPADTKGSRGEVEMAP